MNPFGSAADLVTDLLRQLIALVEPENGKRAQAIAMEVVAVVQDEEAEHDRTVRLLMEKEKDD